MATTPTLHHVTSPDGTLIAFDRLGAGPPIVLAGGADFPSMPETAEALAKALPHGEYRRLEGQGHNVDPAMIGPVLAAFFAA